MNARVLTVASLALLLGACATDAEAGPGKEDLAVRITWPASDDGDEAPLRVEGVERYAELRLAVYVDGVEGAPPVSGAMMHEGTTLAFFPRYPWKAGLTYRVRLILGNDALESTHTFPPNRAPGVTRVSAVYPGADVLPQNLLRFYVHFSAPMSRGEAYERVHVHDETGKEVDAFLEFPQELWDPETTRITLLLDPGRIKRGLRKNLDLGPPLQPEGAYRLIIDADWLDATGKPLVEGFEKRFRTGPPDRLQPDPHDWNLSSPVAGTRDPLVVTFPDLLDRALIRRLLDVRDGAGVSMPGEVEIGPAEASWSFHPARAWSAETYHLVIDSALEDVAGNSLARPFEVALEAAVDQPEGHFELELPFVPSGP